MNSSFSQIHEEIEQLKNKVAQLKVLKPELLNTIQQNFIIEWTYNSNALEGNTLTLGETAFFLQQGLTSEGRPLKDFVETKNHAEAINSLEDFIVSKQPLTEYFIKSLHAVLLKDIDHTVALGGDGKRIQKTLQIGQYKTRPNHVLTLSGKIHHYTDPLQVHPEMEQLINWYKKQNIEENSINIAAELHYRFVNIHPFDDGNGRLARLLMNLILIKAGYPPCIIQNIHRKKYLELLEQTDRTKDLLHFKIFIAEELSRSLKIEAEILESGKKSLKHNIVTQENTKLNRLQREIMILDIIDDPISIGQLESKLPRIKRPTLKKDLQNLVTTGKIEKQGTGKGTLYSRS